MTRDVKLYIKRLESPDAYVLVNENGEMLPFQLDCCLRSFPPGWLDIHGDLSRRQAGPPGG